MTRFAVKYVAFAVIIFTVLPIFIRIGSPSIPHWVVCAITALAIAAYNIFYFIGFLFLAKGSKFTPGSIIYNLSFIVMVTIIYYAAIYQSFYSFDPSLFHYTTSGNLSLLDFCYFSVSTIATVGYGDIVVTTTPLRGIVSLEILNGIALLVFGYSAIDHFVKKINS